MSLLVHLPLQGNFNNYGSKNLTFNTTGTVSWGTSNKYGFSSFLQGGSYTYALWDQDSWGFESGSLSCWVKLTQPISPSTSQVNHLLQFAHTSRPVRSLGFSTTYYSGWIFADGQHIYEEYCLNAYNTTKVPCTLFLNKWIHVAVTSEYDGTNVHKML